MTMRARQKQAGFALILAILALMLLTFLGLTLAATTSTELQIATNYRWSQQAYYNAEAGIEAGKIVLRNIVPDWSTVLPGRRAGTWCSPASGSGCTSPAPNCAAGDGGCTTPAGSGTATRNWELGTAADVAAGCAPWLGTGYGAVLGDGTNVYENVTNFLGQPVNGAFTLWVRRDVVPVLGVAGGAAAYQDDPNNGAIVLTAEGVAPQPANVPGALPQAARAVRVLQVKLSRGLTSSGCQAAEGQMGTTASGANFGACAPLSTGSVDQALGGGAAVAENTNVK
jgi:hypothetical protein